MPAPCRLSGLYSRQLNSPGPTLAHFRNLLILNDSRPYGDQNICLLQEIRSKPGLRRLRLLSSEGVSNLLRERLRIELDFASEEPLEPRRLLAPEVALWSTSSDNASSPRDVEPLLVVLLVFL